MVNIGPVLYTYICGQEIKLSRNISVKKLAFQAIGLWIFSSQLAHDVFNKKYSTATKTHQNKTIQERELYFVS